MTPITRASRRLLVRAAGAARTVAGGARDAADVWGAWPAVAACSSAAVALTTWGWPSSPLRPAVTTWFMLVVPGMTLVRLLPRRDPVLRLVLAVATSLALEAVVATIMAEAKIWSAAGALALLLAITLVAMAAEVSSARRMRPQRHALAASQGAE